ncbi:MAG: recombinase family protein, partial [Alphaproteobacteria bacterium]|nr:recombinase family protein [Alphaproteobacteria bacterium]
RALTQSVALLTRQTKARRAQVERQIVELDVAIAARIAKQDPLAHHHDILCSIPGFGAVSAEQFENDGSPNSTIIKSVKRAMAGEYSRELSVKVFAGQCRLIELGFRQGGTAGYGLRRVLVDQSGEIKGPLKFGEHKSLQTDRVILMPGPEEEVAQVNQMFRWLIDEDLGFSEIAERLNEAGVVTDLNRPWTSGSVKTVLTGEKYIGNNVYNRKSFKLKIQHVENPPDMWIRKEGAFEGVVPLEVFMTAQEIITVRSARLSDEELLEHLKRLYADAGELSGVLIDQADDMPSSSVFRSRFGSLSRAYALIGHQTGFDKERMQVNRRLRAFYPEIIKRTEAAIAEAGGQVRCDAKSGLLHLNDELVISLVLARCQALPDGRHRWRIRFDPARFEPDVTLAVRLDYANNAELDYFLLPGLDLPHREIRMCNRNSAHFEAFRFENLDFFYAMFERVGIWRQAS